MVKRTRKKLGIQIKGPRYFPETEVMDTIVNVPLHPKTGQPIWKNAEVEERKKVNKGWHMFWQVLLRRQRGRGDQFYRRIIIG